MNIIPKPEDFFLETPLYEAFKVDNSNYADVLRIEFFQDTVDTFCPYCGKDTVFESTAKLPQIGPVVRPSTPESIDDLIQEQGSAWLPSIEGDSLAHTDLREYAKRDRVAVMKFECTRTRIHLLYFILRVRNSVLEKIGQSPSLADLQRSQIDRYRKVLGQEKVAEFNRAIGLSAHGVGIGSFVYLRRIFEDLINAAHAEAAGSDSWNEDKDEEFEKARMDEKIRLLSDYLPSFLVENRGVYSILSSGVHTLSEQECLEYFEPTKLAIEIMLDQEIEKQRRIEKESKTRKAINAIKSTLGQRSN